MPPPIDVDTYIVQQAPLAPLCSKDCLCIERDGYMRHEYVGGQTYAAV